MTDRIAEIRDRYVECNEVRTRADLGDLLVEVDKLRLALEWYGEGNGDNGRHARDALGVRCTSVYSTNGRQCELNEGHGQYHKARSNVWMDSAVEREENEAAPRHEPSMPRNRSSHDHSHADWRDRALRAEETIRRLKDMFYDVARVLEVPLPEAPRNEPSTRGERC